MMKTIEPDLKDHFRAIPRELISSKHGCEIP